MVLFQNKNINGRLQGNRIGGMCMCIAIAKKIGGKILPKEILKNAWDNNPHGGGFAYCNSKGEVIISKGFMDFNLFYDTLKTTWEKENLDNQVVLIHTRITTSGGTSAENCHPFPIGSKSKRDLKETYIKSCDGKLAMIHNGIINSFESKEKYDKGYSDTQLFIYKYVNKLYRKNPKFYKDDKIMKKVWEKGERCKFAFISGGNKLYTLGDFHETKEYEGYSFSNYTYSYSKHSYGKSFGYSDSWKWYNEEDAWDTYEYDAYNDYTNSDIGYDYRYDKKTRRFKKVFKDNSFKSKVENIKEWNEDIFLDIVADLDFTLFENGTIIECSNDVNITCNDSADMFFGMDSDHNLYYANWQYTQLIPIVCKIERITKTNGEIMEFKQELPF